MTSDVAVIGAGPAGAAISAILSQNGFSVTVLEKNLFPRFSIGESLLPQCMEFLEEAGLLSAVNPDSFQIKKGALFARGDQKSKIDFSEKFTSGPSETWQVTRAEFDQSLINKSVEYGTEVIFNAEVKEIDFNPSSVQVSFLADGTEKKLETKFLVDASGGAMVLPRLLNSVSKPKLSKVSLFRHFKVDSRNLEESENILISINPNNKKIWYWGIPLKDGNISVGVVTDEKTLSSYNGSTSEQFDKLISEEPNLFKRLHIA
ncbi:MAG: FAD-dependent monooxygenase, partial [Lentisphaeraceae bacterium]|nr:FAD-dependent monooxygenase [Lentisphaeraceae bacterium]